MKMTYALLAVAVMSMSACKKDGATEAAAPTPTADAMAPAPAGHLPPVTAPTDAAAPATTDATAPAAPPATQGQ